MSEDDETIAALADLRDVEPPPSLVAGVMRRIAEPPPVTVWSWLRRRRRMQIAVSPLGIAGIAVGAGVLLFVIAGAWPAARPPSSATVAAVAPPADPTIVVRFVITKQGARKVAVAGDFNGWDPAGTPLMESENGTFAATVRLPRGAHEYMFVVDGEWVTDPAATERRPDGFGRDNGVLRL